MTQKELHAALQLASLTNSLKGLNLFNLEIAKQIYENVDTLVLVKGDGTGSAKNAGWAFSDFIRFKTLEFVQFRTPFRSTPF